jgi:hypothetical protein
VTRLKPDCQWALQRNGPQNLPERKGGTLSPVRCVSKIREIAAISSDLAGIGARFLCVPDCVAERGGFGPTVHIDNTQVIDSTLPHIPRFPPFPDMTAQKRHNFSLAVLLPQAPLPPLQALRLGGSPLESVLSTVGGGRRCDAFYATCSIEFT